MRKLLLAAASLLLAVTSARAQGEYHVQYNYGKALFVSVQGGPVLFYGDYSNAFGQYGKGGKVFSPFGEFSLGYGITNAHFLRLSASYSPKNSALEPVNSTLYDYNFSACELFLEYMVNLNTLGEYYTALNPYLYAGLGGAYTFGYSDPAHPYQIVAERALAPGLRVGTLLEYDFAKRLGAFVDFGLEFFTEAYNGQEPVSFPLDMNMRLGFGLVWHL